MHDPTAHHLGITVAELDRSLAFYRDTLDLSVIDRFEVSGDAFATGVGIDDAAALFVHLDAGDVRLELVSYEPAGEDPAPGALNDTGATHLALGVEDVQASYEALPEAVPTLSAPQTTASGTTICFLRDPDGNLVELLEA
jgi:catechol 2,3-dioxygenase-like lactoylglutathione lyase family enzyme